MATKKLKMVQCNLHRCYLAQQEFLQHFTSEKFDIGLISEPYVGRGLCMPSKPGLVDIYQFPSSTQVKACVVLKAGISAIGLTQYSTPNLAVIQLKLGQQKLYIASVYVEPDCDSAGTLASLAYFLTEPECWLGGTADTRSGGNLCRTSGARMLRPWRPLQTSQFAMSAGSQRSSLSGTATRARPSSM
jgi:hypothetical protein